MSLTNEIQSLLRKAKVDFNESESDTSGDLYALFKALIPDRCLDYDAECIDEIGDYAYVLEDHAKITADEFSPSGVSVAGGGDKKVVVQFEFHDKTYKLRIDDSGSDYVDPSFYDALNKFCKKALPGSFITLPTQDQSIACVYLPKKLVATIEKKYLRASSTDALADYLKSGGDPYQIEWNDVPFQIRNGSTSEGESIATAIVKSAKPREKSYQSTPAEGALETLKEEGMVCVLLQNGKGETPYSLARAAGLTELVTILEQRADPVPYDEFAAIVDADSRPNVTETLAAVFKQAAPHLGDMFFNKNHHSWFLQFSHEESFILGEDTFSLLCYSDAFELHVQTPGEDGGVLVREFEKDDVDEIAEIIRKYCNRELWA